MNTRDQLKAVAVTRTEVANLKRQKKELEDTFQAEHLPLFQQVQERIRQLSIAEATLRDMAVADWLDARQKDPALSKIFIPGAVTIRESKIAVFDREIAEQWALEHKVALTLDEATYRKLVLLKQAPGYIETDYTAAIAADLDAVLGRGEE